MSPPQPVGDAELAELIDLFGLRPLPVEGGWWAPGPRTAQLSVIRYLLTPEGFSALHRLTVTEGWQWLAGAPVRVVVLGDAPRPPKPPGPSGPLGPPAPPAPLESAALWQGDQLLDGPAGQAVVPAGRWFGAHTLGPWTLVSCWCAPAYTDDCFELGDRAQLTADFPQHDDDILRLTRLTRP